MTDPAPPRASSAPAETPARLTHWQVLVVFSGLLLAMLLAALLALTPSDLRRS